MTRAPSGSTVPPSSTSVVVTRNSPCAGDSSRRISSIAFARSSGSSRCSRSAGSTNMRFSALPIARVTVTWPATIRSSGRPAISTVLSGSSVQSFAATIAPSRSSVGFARRSSTAATQYRCSSTSPRAWPSCSSSGRSCCSEQPVESPPMDPLEILAREAEQLAEHPERKRPGERLDDVRVPAGASSSISSRGDRLDPRLELVRSSAA